MNRKDYIKKAVELAEGWEFEVHGESVSTCIRTPSQFRSDCTIDGPDTEILDALAAQLVRQVDAKSNLNDEPAFASEFSGCAIIVLSEDDWHGGKCGAGASKNDRTMNTIRAIVDSKVLENE